MAAYATRAELVQLGIADAALAKVSADDQDTALAAASRVADSYLIRRFTLPLTSWGDDLKQAICDIVAYRLMKARGFNPQRSDADQLRDGYTDAIKWLKDVADSKATPVGIVDSDPLGTSNTDATGEARQRAFVLQATTDGTVDEDFWGNQRTVGGSTGVPTKRGW